MSYSTATQARPLLDSGQILENSFGVIRRGFLVLTAIAVVPWLPLIALFWLFPHSNLPLLIGVVLWTLTASALTRAAFRIHHEQSVQVLPALRAGLKGLGPLLICAIAAVIALYIASILIVPAIYLMGMWCVIIPAIAIENRGFGAFGRSAELTRYYRWALGFFWLLFQLAALIICSIPMFLGAGITAGVNEVVGGDIASSIGGLAMIITWATTFNIMAACLTAMMYTRLLEIEEGMGTDGAASIFE